MRRRLALLTVVLTVSILPAAPPAAAAVGDTHRVSLTAGAAQANGASQLARFSNVSGQNLSDDGRYVVFHSDADNLVASDTNSVRDVFRKDWQSGAIVRVSVTSGGSQGNGGSEDPAISGDGRWVAFQSDATNLGGGGAGCFLKDLDTGNIVRFTTSCVWTPSLSTDGRYVAFETVVQHDPVNDTSISTRDVYVYDRVNATYELVSADSTGAAWGVAAYGGNSISGNGRYVAFQARGAIIPTTAPCGNFCDHIYVRDLQSDTTERASVSSSEVDGSGDSLTPDISNDGRYVTFTSNSNNLDPLAGSYTQRVYLRDRTGGTTTLISRTTSNTAAGGEFPSISTDGAAVSFYSTSSALVASDANGTTADIFKYTVSDGSIVLASKSTAGAQASVNPNYTSAVSNGGAYVVWDSTSDTYVGAATDTNGAADVFLHEFSQPTFALSVATAGTGSGSVSSNPAGISCGADCAESYASGTSVTLTATPDSSSAFTSWSGCDSSSGNECTVGMSSVKNVTATFTLLQYALSVTKAGSGTGTVTSDPAGINCGSTCSASYGHGTSVALTATPTGSDVFSGWSGACSGTGSCTVSMTEARSVSATFAPPATPPPSDPAPPPPPVESPAPGPGVSVGDLSIKEGDTRSTTAVVPLTIDEPTSQPVTVTYDLVPGTAQPDADYTPRTGGTAVIPPGETSGVIPITIRGDLLVEENETFFVRIRQVSGAPISRAAGTVTILDDDEVCPGFTGPFLEKYNFIHGTDASERLEGTAGADFICARGGDDTIVGSGGNDFLVGNDGNDTIQGGPGDDGLYGGVGNDVLTGETGDDTLVGGNGADIATGGDGNDSFRSEGVFDGTDTFDGGTGTDRFSYGQRAASVSVSLDGIANDGEPGENDVFGPSIEIFEGGAGNDHITGSTSADTLEGGDGDDKITGGAGNDKEFGGAGDDVFDQGSSPDGNDDLTGGEGTDLVSYALRADRIKADLTDTIQSDGAPSESDYIRATTEGVEGGSASDNLTAEWAIGGPSGDGLVASSVGSRLFGGEGFDRLTGSGSADLLDGGGDDDTIIGDAGDDRIHGGSGKDRIEAGDGNDTVDGGAGDDQTIDGGMGDDRIQGGVGKDRIEAATGADTVDGGADDDQLFGGWGNDSLSGGDGDDTLLGELGGGTFKGGEGKDFIGAEFGSVPGTARFNAEGGAGNDTITGSSEADVLNGGDGVDTISGLAGPDKIVGGGDGDFLNGMIGDDDIAGNGGTDEIRGGENNDTLAGDDGDDELNGGMGDDTMYGRGGDDTLTGEWGDDIFNGGDGNDDLGIDPNAYADDNNTFEPGADRMFGGSGDDVLTGGNQNDVMHGEGGVDGLRGNAGSDQLNAGAGDDWLQGGFNADTMYGGDGKDDMVGGWGSDTMYGNAGDDILNGWFSGGAVHYQQDEADADSGSKDRLFGGEGTDDCYNGEEYDSCFLRI